MRVCRIGVNTYQLISLCIQKYFFLSGSSFPDINNSLDSRRGKATIFSSSLPLPTTQNYLDIYLKFPILDGYLTF